MTLRFGQATVLIPVCLGSIALLVWSDSRAANIPASPPGSLSLRWDSQGANSTTASVLLIGLDARAVRALQMVRWSSEQWQKLLAIYVEQGDVLTDATVPPMLGTYRLEANSVRFTPQFPLQPGLRYRAVLQPTALPGRSEPAGRIISATFQVPRRVVLPTTVVAHVYPSAATLPENLLKFYLHFSAPMSGGHIYQHIHLLDSAQKEVELPFLEIDEELWDPAMTRLTLFIDPGRIKRGVQPLEEIGPSLEAGRSYTLLIDPNWLDATGTPLRTDFRKQFTVSEPDRDPPDPARWKVESPRAGSRETLIIHFNEPMDHALSARVISVADPAGRRIEGKSTVGMGEQQWSFSPAQPWEAGLHRLLVENTLEDLAGNNIGKPFEVDLFEGVQKRLTRTTVSVPVEIR